MDVTCSTSNIYKLVAISVDRIMANLASPIPMMDPIANIDSGYVPSNIEAEKEHTPTPSPKEDKKKDIILPKKPELKKKLSRLSSCSLFSTLRRKFHVVASSACFTIFKANTTGKLRAKSFAKKEKKVAQTLTIVLGIASAYILWDPRVCRPHYQ